jgi:integrase/recombinase XerC
MFPHRIRHSVITAALDATEGNVRKCRNSADTKFKYLDGVCDNRGPDQRDITDLLDGMKGAIGREADDSA